MKNEIKMMLQIEELIEQYDSEEKSGINNERRRYVLVKDIIQIVANNLLEDK